MPSYILPDELRSNLDVVFCGTAASAKSAAVRAYYAGPGNRFWQTLHDIGLTPRMLHPHEFKDATAFGIGFTDLAKYTSGQDSGLKPRDFDSATLRAKIERFAPKAIAFNGKKAGSVFLGLGSPGYGLQPESISETAVFVLPSTSAAAKRYWEIRYWQGLTEYLGRL